MRSAGKMAVLGLWMVFLAPGHVWAQTAQDIEAAQRQAEILQRQEQQRLENELEEARRRGERVDGLDTSAMQPRIAVPDIGAPCRDIARITITGAAKLEDPDRLRILEQFTGRCLNSGDIERILAEITKYYIDRGFITTRAYLPAQDLSKGQLDILVIEGVVDRIMVNDGQANSISVGNVFPGVEGDLLNLRDLEQGIDQINRLSSNNARLDIQPGEKAGSSVVVVHNQPKSPLHLFMSFDNQGASSTGRTQAGVSLSVDNPLDFNDQLFLTHRESLPGDADRRLARSDSLGYSIPFGYTTVSVSASRSSYVSMIRVPSGLELLSSGNNKNDSVRVDRVLYRDQDTRVSLAAALTTKKAKNYLDHQLLQVSSRKLTVVDVDASLNTGLFGGVLTLELGYAEGLNELGALDDPANLPVSSPHAQFTKLKYGVGYALPLRVFDRDASFTSHFSGQKADDALYGSEQIAIGGLYSVRGFVRNTLAGDDGFYWRNEFSVRQPVQIAGETINGRAYVGYDYGRVSNLAPNIPQGRMSGMVVGVSASWKGLTLDLFNTLPLSLPSNMKKESGQTWFRIAFSI